MNSFIKKGLYCALFVGGLSVLGVGAANAAETSGESGVASVSQVAPNAYAPVTVQASSISLLSDAATTGVKSEPRVVPRNDNLGLGDGIGAGDGVTAADGGAATSGAPAASFVHMGGSSSPFLALVALFPLMGLVLLMLVRHNASRL